MASRIEQIIDEIEDYIDGCKTQAFAPSKIIVNRETMEERAVQAKEELAAAERKDEEASARLME